jgi:hypothetical protein
MPCDTLDSSCHAVLTGLSEQGSDADREAQQNGVLARADDGLGAGTLSRLGNYFVPTSLAAVQARM